MLDDIKSYNKEQSKQTKSVKQIESWVDNEDIEKIYKSLEFNAKYLYKKSKYEMNDLQEIQNFIILSLLSGIFIPPRRSKDFTNFKISNIEPNQDNFFNKNCMVFNAYKTAKTYGQQIIKIPIKLNRILKKWIKINPTEYLLFDKDLNPLSNVTLNQRLNKIFNKKVGVNQLRHTYLSDKYQETIKLNKEMADDMKAMGSSRAQEAIYIKKD
jgi:integrase